MPVPVVMPMPVSVVMPMAMRVRQGGALPRHLALRRHARRLRPEDAAPGLLLALLQREQQAPRARPVVLERPVAVRGVDLACCAGGCNMLQST